MELLEFPRKEIWELRYKFVEDELEKAETGGHAVSDHAVALFMEMQCCYCVGAWVSVIILSVSVIDAHLREIEAMDARLGTAKLLEDYFEGEDINWLRKLRNKYVHSNLNNPTLDLNAQYENRDEFEKAATKALKMTISALFQNGFT